RRAIRGVARNDAHINRRVERGGGGSDGFGAGRRARMAGARGSWRRTERLPLALGSARRSAAARRPRRRGGTTLSPRDRARAQSSGAAISRATAQRSRSTKRVNGERRTGNGNKFECVNCTLPTVHHSPFTVHHFPLPSLLIRTAI